MQEISTTLLLIIKDGKILLPRKKRGFGEGKFNGVGGKVKGNETIEQAMLRETMEEINIVPVNYEKVGYSVFDEYFKGEKTRMNMTTFLAKDYVGTITESDEMEPFWFNLNEIPFYNMLPDDPYWMPFLLKGAKFEAYFDISSDGKVISYKITEV